MPNIATRDPTALERLPLAELREHYADLTARLSDEAVSLVEQASPDKTFGCQTMHTASIVYRAIQCRRRH